MQETCIPSLGQKDPLEQEMETHSRIFAWKIPGTEEPGGLQSMVWWRKDERADKTKEGLGMQEWKNPDPYRPSLPHAVTINGFHILLSSPPTP